MKKSLLFYSLSGLIALAGLTGCEEKLEGPANPAKEGDEITFGATSNENPIVRTVYDDVPTVGEDGTAYFRVSWEADGSDQIAIYCPEAQGTTLCNYSITPDANDPTRSSLVTKVNEDKSGLLWGETDMHHFYGFYPASAVTGTENGKIKAEIPVLQNPTGWNEKPNNAGGTNFYGTANTDYAFMWAYGEHGRYSTAANESVGLTFHPWVTILEIKVPGPKGGSKMKVSSINVDATEGTQTVLAGDFVCDMTPVINGEGEGLPVYEAVGNQGEVRDRITISCFNENIGENGDFIELGENDTLIVRAYLLPYDQTMESRRLQVRVSPVNRGVLTRSLKDPQSEGGVLPHKVNTVILPPLSDNGYNYWMSSLDPNVYLSELSIPGSWNSMNQGSRNTDFQTGSIIDQFNAGVRGFMVGTGASYSCQGIFGSGEYESGYLYIDTNIRNNITSILEDLSNALDNLGAGHENEFVFLQVSCNGNEDGPSRSQYSAYEAWMHTVEYQFNQLKQNNQYNLYLDPITPDTKIADVAGKIVLKFNTNNDNMDEIIAANAQLPALFIQWKGGCDVVDMRWGSPNHSNTAALKWFFQEADNIYQTGGTSSGSNVTQADKEQWIKDVFQQSVTLYEQGDAHDTWFFNCLGGKYDGSNNAVSWTNYISPRVTQTLQERTENASLGLVFMNHVNSNGTANILQTIIDNNFKFQLRKAGN